MFIRLAFVFSCAALFERLPSMEGRSFEVWVSQDGEHAGVKALVQNKFPQVFRVNISYACLWLAEQLSIGRGSRVVDASMWFNGSR